MSQKLSLTPSRLIIFQVYYNIIVKFLITDLGLPSVLNYISDVITIVLVCKFFSSKRGLKIQELRIIKGLCILYYCIFILLSFAESVTPILVAWSLRNNLRFIFWIFIVSRFLKQKEIDDLFSSLNSLIFINLIVMGIQYILLGLRDDRLNGLFGSYIGGNSAVNTFAVILTCENIAAYLTKRRKITRTIINIMALCITCALNELKYYFLELVIIVLIFVVNEVKCNGTVKAFQRVIKILIGGAFLSIVGCYVLLHFYPGFSSFIKKEVFMDYLTRSYNSSDLIYVNGIPISNRFTIYGTIVKYFLTSPFKIIFGNGLGSAEYNAFFESVFWDKYQLIGTNNYCFSHIFLETGILGCCIYLLMFMITIKASWKESANKPIRYYCLISLGCAVMGILMNFYNSALKIESSGYMFFLGFSLAYCRYLLKSHTR